MSSQPSFVAFYSTPLASTNCRDRHGDKSTISVASNECKIMQIMLINCAWLLSLHQLKRSDPPTDRPNKSLLSLHHSAQANFSKQYFIHINDFRQLLCLRFVLLVHSMPIRLTHLHRAIHHFSSWHLHNRLLLSVSVFSSTHATAINIATPYNFTRDLLD